MDDLFYRYHENRPEAVYLHSVYRTKLKIGNQTCTMDKDGKIYAPKVTNILYFHYHKCGYDIGKYMSSLLPP